MQSKEEIAIEKLELLLKDLKIAQKLRKENKVVFNENLEAIRIKEILKILKGEADE